MSLAIVSKQTAQTAAYHVGAQVWVPVKSPADALGRKGAARWVKGRVTAVSTEKNGTSLVEVQTDENHNLTLKAADCPLQNERDDTVDDLVKSDFLHEPGYAYAQIEQLAYCLCSLCVHKTCSNLPSNTSLHHAGSYKPYVLGMGLT